jgi:hypothetical protein
MEERVVWDRRYYSESFLPMLENSKQNEIELHSVPA